jgi:hypothetical protein
VRGLPPHARPADIVAFLDIAQGPDADRPCPGCPIAPTALESAIRNPRLNAAAARCFNKWEALIAARPRADGWPETSLAGTAAAALALIEGALLLARVADPQLHLTNAKYAAISLLSAPPGKPETVPDKTH